MSDILIPGSKKVMVAGKEFEIKKLTYANRIKSLGLLAVIKTEKQTDSTGKEVDRMILPDKASAEAVANNMTALFQMLLGESREWVETHVYPEDAEVILSAFTEVNGIPLQKSDQAPQ